MKEPKVCEIEGETSIPREENLVWKAVNAFRKGTGNETGVRIILRKSIPMGAGLGGGSSDAASTLLGLNELAGRPLGEETLSRIGATIGSDVPFFCRAATAVVSGRGEKILPIQGSCDYRVLVVVPPFHVATRDAYTWIDQEQGWTLPRVRRTEESLTAMLQMSVREWEFFNAFEPILEKRYSVYNTIRGIFRETGALYASISGSGSSMFGVYASDEEVREGERVLKQHFSVVKVTIPLDRRPIPILE
ncbi:MAG: 4-(cytidine 5'-diphospho)-2-C-methyl-D-erythritol kinase [Spirochaetales bacterium]